MHLQRLKQMTNSEFWKYIDRIIAQGFNADGLKQLENYAELFISGRLVYKRFSPLEQHGCAAGGSNHVIASLLAGASIDPSSLFAPEGSFQRERECAETQANRIEQWAKIVGCWMDDVDKSLPSLLGEQMTDEEIQQFAERMGFELRNPRNWTYTTPEIYLSDLHDENVIKSANGNVFVIDCDIRLNTPDLKLDGVRELTTDIEFI